MSSIIDDYISYHKIYFKKYGDRTLVLMQVGSFYEAYATETLGPDLRKISDLINIVCTRKDRKDTNISIKNPFMLGFPLISAEKHISLLVNNGYTLIIIDQVTPPPDPKREVTNIISPGTYIGATPSVETNFVCTIFFEYEKQKNGKTLLCAGMSAIDVTTGKVITYESHSTSIDTEISLDDASRFITSTQPKELVMVKNGDGKMSIESICEYLQLDKNKLQILNHNPKYSKLSYQNELLKNVYETNTNMLSPIESLELEKCNYARLALVTCINFLIEHNEKLINRINVPEIFMDRSHLLLGNNAIYQLNVLESDSYNYTTNNKIKCLYDVVNNATTGMGKRYVKQMLLSPMIDSEEIKKNYDRIEKALKNDTYIQIEKGLMFICDIEKLQRKVNIGSLQPYEMADMIISYGSARELITLLQEKKINDILPDKKIIEDLDDFNKEMIEIFDISALKQNILSNIRTSFFVKGVSHEIDALVEGCLTDQVFMADVANYFEKLLGLAKSSISIKTTKSEGYFLKITPKKYDLLIEKLEGVKKAKTISGVTINENAIRSKHLKSSVKIFVNSKISERKSNTEEEMSRVVYATYLTKLSDIFAKYNKMFTTIIKFITLADYVKSCAKTAKLYNYIRPDIVNKDYGYVKVENIRHPVVERIIDYEYIPHSVELGDSLKGMLIYGLNSAGKSVLMKAVGLLVILAQAGMFVPATKCTISPYDSIYARITGNDNIFRGLSSFSLEMVELNAILKRANKKTLVIGDEVCRGTEHISGNALVASTIVKLSNVSATFIFATHLHELVGLNCIKKLENVKAFHLSTEYDENKDMLIYDRKLKDGSGDTVYGINVAKYIIQDKEFMKLTLDIKNELTDSFNTLISGKTSRYNKDIYVYKCEICGRKDLNGEFSPLETHHINYQRDCENGFSKNKPHIQKNSKANLIVICEKCHQKIHRDEIAVEGYVMTSVGKKAKVTKK
jgi:DNA mismatch repair protein MutS